MVYILVDSHGKALNEVGSFGPLNMAQLFPAVIAAEKLREFPHTYAVRLDVRAPRPHRIRRQQAGFAGTLLLEMLIVSMVFLVLAAIAVPNLLQMRYDQQQSDAHARVALVAKAKAAVTVCNSTVSCTPSAALEALVPANGSSISMNGYTFVESSDGTAFTATPLYSQGGQQSYYVGSDAIVRCGATAGSNPCTY